MERELDIDVLYEEFCGSLPAELEPTARALSQRLALAPSPDIPWSEVFKHRVTLHAPALFEGVLPRPKPRHVERAVLAHMLAVIEAFGTDRIEDRQVPDEPRLREVLRCARDARDVALVELGGASARELAAESDARTLDAIATERRLFLRGSGVSFETYRTVSAGKQSVGLPGTIVLARASGWDARSVELARSTLLSLWLGLQFQDDVFDWEDDLARGGAWAVLLADPSPRGEPRGSRSLDDARASIFASNVLSKMLELALEEYRQALDGAEQLAARPLVEWLRGRVEEAAELWEDERESPGRLLRRRKLAPWAREVLA